MKKRNSLRIIQVSVLCGAALIYFSGCAKLSGLNTLMQVGKSDKLKERALHEETVNFLRVKKHIEDNTIEKGISKERALKLFGKPVIVFSKEYGDKWVYKEGQSDWFEGEKIYLFFNPNGELEYWEIINPR